MEQHPVPQPITSYEFRLVGDMTIKQFAKLASGLILALIVYAVNPPWFLKWPLILTFSGLGAAMAFVPYEGRPIDTWIIAFLKRIYSPTQYVWKPNEKMTPSIKETINPQSLQVNTNQNQVLLNTTQSQAEGQTINKPLSAQTITSPQTSSPPPISVNRQQEKQQSFPPQPKETVLKAPQLKTEIQSQPSQTKVEAKFAPNVIIPATPTMSNLIVGFIHDKNNKLIEGAILEIRDSFGNPVRAFKSNKLGQFLSATPLPNGEYEIETEKEGFEFDIIKIKLNGEIVPPIEIVSK